MNNVIRTWKWTIPEDPASLPADIPFMYCRQHPKTRDLVPVLFEEGTVYLCPQCGNVYSVDRGRKGTDKLRIWPRLYKQPYDWNTFYEGSLAHAYLHCREGIRFHPFIARHCAAGEQDAADLLIRYLTRIAAEWAGAPFFRNQRKNVSVETDSLQNLIITAGNPSVPYPIGDYTLFRETADSITLENSKHRYFIDQPPGIEDVLYEFLYCRITFLGCDPDGLPGDIERTDPQMLRPLGPDNPVPEGHMAELVKSMEPQKWISADPFGLSGYYLFEGKNASFILDA